MIFLEHQAMNEINMNTTPFNMKHIILFTLLILTMFQVNAQTKNLDCMHDGINCPFFILDRTIFIIKVIICRQMMMK